MTFLELCQQVVRDAGISGTGPSTVVSQSGTLKRVVGFTAAAWQKIQGLHTDWSFMRGDASFTLTPATQAYSLATIRATIPLYDVPDLNECRWTDKSGRLQKVDWSVWTGGNYDLATGTGKPQLVTERTDRALLFYPIPTAANVFTMKYRRTPQVLAANADEPICPTRHHEVIAYRALMLWAAFDQDGALLKTATDEYEERLSQLERECRPTVSFGGARLRSSSR